MPATVGCCGRDPYGRLRDTGTIPSTPRSLPLGDAVDLLIWTGPLVVLVAIGAVFATLRFEAR